MLLQTLPYLVAVCALGTAATHCMHIVFHPFPVPGVRHKGERLRSGLREAFGGNPHVKEVRGQGLICGIQLDTVTLALHAPALVMRFAACPSWRQPAAG